MDGSVAVRIEKRKLAEIKAISEEEKRKNSDTFREVIDLGLKEKKLAIALEKYEKGEVSTGKAAEIAAVPLSKFLDTLRERNVPFRYSLKELQEDFEGYV